MVDSKKLSIFEYSVSIKVDSHLIPAFAGITKVVFRAYLKFLILDFSSGNSLFFFSFFTFGFYEFESISSILSDSSFIFNTFLFSM